MENPNSLIWVECAVGKQAAFKAKSFVAPKHQQQAQQQAAMEKNLSEKRFSSSQNKHHPPPPKKENKSKKTQKAHRKGFRALNKFALSGLFLLWINVILFHVYSLGVKESLTKIFVSEENCLKTIQ